MTSSQWVNLEDEGALPVLLRRLESEIAADRIDELWIFPTRRGSGAESTVIVVSAFAGEADRRRVGTVHFKVVRDRRGRATVEHDLREVATAPAEAVPRVVDGVLLRLGEEAAQPPRCESIAGETGRFEALVRELGGAPKPEPDEPVTGPGGTEGDGSPGPAADAGSTAGAADGTEVPAPGAVQA